MRRPAHVALYVLQLVVFAGLVYGLASFLNAHGIDTTGIDP